MSRCNYIDAARGAAIIPMIINHTGHAWLIPALSAGTLFYLTEATAAPLFLFVAGFSLTLSWSRTNTSALRWKINNVLRAVFLIVLGYFLNLLLFPGQLLFFMGPLQTIGLGTLLLIPLMPILKQRWARYLLILLACTCYGVFAWHAKAITNTILFHHDLGKMFFFQSATLALDSHGYAGWGDRCKVVYRANRTSATKNVTSSRVLGQHIFSDWNDRIFIFGMA
jgi:uncharacterized membrane protein